jgi:hypothetical protein
MDPNLGFWPALGITWVVTIGAAQLVVGKFAHPWMQRKVKAEYPEDAGRDEDAEKTAGAWLVVWVGVIETTVFLCFFVFNVAAVGAFIGAWMIVKMGTGWHRLALARKSRYYPRMGFVALLLTLMNVLIALVGARLVFVWLT